LESIEKDILAKRRKMRGAKYPVEPTLQDAGSLVDMLRDGLVTTYGEEGKEPAPLVTSGLRGTKGTDFAVVSVPDTQFEWHARVVIACALFRIGLAIVSEPHYGELWFWVWKRNVDRLAQEKKTLVVITRTERFGGAQDRVGNGRVDYAQTLQVLYLQERGYTFVAVDAMHFCRDLSPAVTAAAANDFQTLEQTFMAKKALHVPLRNVVDGTGRTALHYAAIQGPSERVMRLLGDIGEDVNARQWQCDAHNPGWTPLHYAAAMGPPRMIRLLFEMKANPHIVNAANKTPIDLAKGRREAERMMSQCHWKLCVVCNSVEEDEENPKPKGPPPMPAEEQVVDTAAMHAKHCSLCSRFT